MLYNVLLEELVQAPLVAAEGGAGRLGAASRRVRGPCASNDRKEQPRHVGVICHKVTTLHPFVDERDHRVAQEANNG